MARIPASKRTRKRAPGEICPVIATLNEAIAGGKIGWVLEDFLPCSFGGRPSLSAHHALATTSAVLRWSARSETVTWNSFSSGSSSICGSNASTAPPRML
jgi:hypothetical protein